MWRQGCCKPRLLFRSLWRWRWYLSVQAEFRGGAARWPVRTAAQPQHINLISSLYCSGNNTEESSDWSRGFRAFHSIKSVHLVIFDACLGGHDLTDTQDKSVLVSQSSWFLLIYIITIQQLFPFPSSWSAIRKTCRDETWEHIFPIPLLRPVIVGTTDTPAVTSYQFESRRPFCFFFFSLLSFLLYSYTKFLFGRNWSNCTCVKDIRFFLFVFI